MKVPKKTSISGREHCAVGEPTENKQAKTHQNGPGSPHLAPQPSTVGARAPPHEAPSEQLEPATVAQLLNAYHQFLGTLLGSADTASGRIARQRRARRVTLSMPGYHERSARWAVPYLMTELVRLRNPLL